MASESLSKKRAAELLGVSRSSLYYLPKLPTKDESLKAEILQVLSLHPGYGYRRVALTLLVNKKRIQRVMRKFALSRKRVRRKRVKNRYQLPTFPAENLLARLCPLAPGVVWVTDFTYLSYKSRTLYFATVVDRFSRDVVGVALSFRHSSDLVLDPLRDAAKRSNTDHLYLVHSDQGSEYLAEKTRTFITSLGAFCSYNARSSPWHNAFQESFYSQFKQEMGDLDRFASIGQLMAEIYRFVTYYNTRRIHSALKMPPIRFKMKHLEGLQTVSNKKGS